jgi:hypothetical protein
LSFTFVLKRNNYGLFQNFLTSTWKSNCTFQLKNSKKLYVLGQLNVKLQAPNSPILRLEYIIQIFHRYFLGNVEQTKSYEIFNISRKQEEDEKGEQDLDVNLWRGRRDLSIG